MSGDSASARSSLVMYGICLPVAIFLGFLLVNIVNDPYGSMVSKGMVGVLLMLMLLPLFMRYYHPWLIAVWNMAMVIMFLPGDLMGWTLMSLIGFTLAVGHYILNRQRKFISVPSITRPLIFLAVVVGMTAYLRGGIGLHVFGDESIGGKRYLLIWVSIMGYFALTSQAIRPEKRKLMTIIFVLGGATAMISDIGGMIGGPIQYIGYIFPLTDATTLASQGASGVERLGGLANGALCVALALVAYFGIERIADLKKLWRGVLFAAFLLLTMSGGFRGLIILAALTCGLVFYFEGLLRSRLLPIVLLAVLLFGTLAFAFAEHMPLSFQRSVAFLPLKLDPVAIESAEDSSNWRLDIWKSLVPQIPHYLILGKGLGIDFNDLASYYEFGNSQVGGVEGGGFTLAGDYHNGPLSLIIQFGLWGALGFLWLVVASLKVLWANYKYGDPEIKQQNIYLLAFYIAKIVMFFAVFGSFYTDITVFAGIIGFSISLNGGVAKPASVPRPKIVFNRFRPLPAPIATA
jgi:hypothetical protein